jgi:membrane associated rhomboid family serine protease
MVMVFGDNLHRRRTAFATYAIALVCLTATLIEMSAPGASAEINRTFAFVPLKFSLHSAASAYTLITAEFFHSGLVHLIGNLIFLLAFGRSIEIWSAMLCLPQVLSASGPYLFSALGS